MKVEDLFSISNNDKNSDKIITDSDLNITSY
jgi:hypothetical protein